MIDKTAIVDSKAKLDKNVRVGPYCVIGPNVEIGESTVIQSHVNISGNVKIGKGNNGQNKAFQHFFRKVYQNLRSQVIVFFYNTPDDFLLVWRRET